MGCGASAEPRELEFGKVEGLPLHPEEHDLRKKRRRKGGGKWERKDQVTTGTKDNLSLTASNNTNTSTTNTPVTKGSTKKRKSADEAELPGRSKYLPVPVVNEARDKEAHTYTNHISVFSHISSNKGLTFAVRRPCGTVHAAEFTDNELEAYKNEKGIKHSWATFFKAVNSAFSKGTPKVAYQDGIVTLEMVLSSTKEPRHQNFDVKLKKVGSGPAVTLRYFVEPFFKFYGKPTTKRHDSETRYWQIEGTAETHDVEAEKLNQATAALRQQGSKISERCEECAKRTQRVRNQTLKLERHGSTRHPLDIIYNHGGAVAFGGHTPHAHERDIEPIEYNKYAVALIESKFPTTDLASLVTPPSDPLQLELVRGAPDQSHLDIMRCFQKLDDWDYNVFDVEDLTKGGALFHTAYALLYKHGLVSHFGVDTTILRNFLTAVQAGYHPNPYHNSTHAADVLHITHYILGPGGLGKLAKISKEDLFAALIAATIHDYDHPGFNNNFHTRTSAYLATLYNDKSILENHHCASVFEMMYHHDHDILAALTEDQRKEVRDTVVDMLLSTDMGNHAKIFSTFRRRLNEAEDWATHKEDTRLALVMAIKMADISNCGRPNNLYLRWAKNIANEFYNQGDTEARLNLPISPFMDRSKDTTDFSKGQISFINFIVVPLFEAMSELLPNMEFAVQICNDNKAHWQTDKRA